MLVIITGGSKCGKSSMAEDIITKYKLKLSNPKLYYIATMEPFGEEAKKAIKRHEAMRQGKGFVTIEKYIDIIDITKDPLQYGINPDEDNIFLLECMGNLVANEMFSDKITIDYEKRNVVEKIVNNILSLNEMAALLVIVTNQVGEDGIVYYKETMDYIKNIGDINSALSKKADTVIEAVFGLPVYLKSTENGV